MAPKVSIIIGTYQHLNDCLRPCIESIQKYTDLSDKEVIIVANGCTDGTREYVESLGEPFKLAWSDQPLGYAGANNAGVEFSTGEYVVLLNNDCILLPQPKDQWINLLMAPFIKYRGICATGPIKGHSDPAGREFLIFFCAMLSREAINDVGLLSDEFAPGGGEDTDWCIRAEERRWMTVQVPMDEKTGYDPAQGVITGSFPIYHKGEATMNDNSEWQKIFDRNSLLLGKKYNSEWYKWKLSNNCERAVIGKNDDIPPRERTRYEWAALNMAGDSILEIGCSSGYGTRLLPKNIWYVGVDYDTEIIDYATDQFGDDLHMFDCGDINDIFSERANMFYQTIIAFEVIEHLDRGREIAQELKQHCDCLLMTVPFSEIPPGLWGPHHKLHGLTEKDFPGFEYQIITEDGRIVDKPERFDGMNLLLMKWVRE